MIYKCPYEDNSRSCGICTYEPVCYDSDYMRAFYEVQQKKLFDAELLYSEEETS